MLRLFALMTSKSREVPVFVLGLCSSTCASASLVNVRVVAAWIFFEYSSKDFAAIGIVVPGNPFAINRKISTSALSNLAFSDLILWLSFPLRDLSPIVIGSSRNLYPDKNG